MAAVAGLRGTGDWGLNERPTNFREYIMWRNPNGSTPLLALMSKVGKESTDDPMFNWWDEPSDIIRLQVGVAALATDTTITVSSQDPSATAPNNNWGVASHLVPQDVLMVEPVADSAAFTPEYLTVTSVQSDTQFTCARGALGSTPAPIPLNSFLLKIGSSFSEGTAEPQATSRNPILYFNYTQIFKTVYDVTNTAVGTRARTGDVLKNERKRRAFDHAKDIELALMFGRQLQTIGANGKPQRTMDGIRRWIPAINTTVFTGSVSWTGTTNNFLDAVYQVFNWDTGAGDQRIALCGNGALNALVKITAKDANSRINFSEAITNQYGMALRELILPQGSLFLRTHPLLNRHALYTNSLWIIDFSALRWRYLTGRDTKTIDDIQLRGEDATRGMWITEGGLEVRYGGLTCGYLGNIQP